MKKLALTAIAAIVISMNVFAIHQQLKKFEVSSRINLNLISRVITSQSPLAYFTEELTGQTGMVRRT